MKVNDFFALALPHRILGK